MSVSDFFSKDYAHARMQFRAAADGAGAEVITYLNPAKGPNGEELTTDIAWLGPRDAKHVLVTISGTHGAEGFCGSGVQVGWFRSGRANRLPVDTALLQIHAANPFGFSWLRRTTEDNVDLNRNYVDFSKPLPINEGYEKYRDLLCPSHWDDQVAENTWGEIEQLIEKLPPLVMQGAMCSGQYSDPKGIFFGGQEPSWSRLTIQKIFERYLSKAQNVAIIDYHTGLGPRGYGERICDGEPGSEAWDRAQDWWGDVTSPQDGTSSSPALYGLSLPGMAALIPQANVTATALEYGTLPLKNVLNTVRADNWLHAHGDLGSDQGKAIKAMARDTFYQDADDWKKMIWSRGIDTQEIALARLAG